LSDPKHLLGDLNARLPLGLDRLSGDVTESEFLWLIQAEEASLDPLTQLKALIVRHYYEGPPDGGHWSMRALAESLHIPEDRVRWILWRWCREAAGRLSQRRAESRHHEPRSSARPALR
jgi:hypothetical protein